MVLTAVEKCEIKKILQKLDYDDLISLSKTITSRFVNDVNGKEDAMNCILLYGNNAISILRRRKVKKEFIFQYLKDENVVVDVSKDKLHFINACLKHWQSDLNQVADYEMEIDESIDSLDETRDSKPDDSEPSFVSESTNQVYFHNQQTVVTNDHNFIANEELNSMVASFSIWFYNFLKPESDLSSFGPQLFWPDCDFRVIAVNNEGEQCVCASNNFKTHLVIESLIKKGLHFQPNSTFNQFKCVMNAYGFVKMAIFGAIYRHNQCLGTFDHMFGLIQCPQETETTWKIKCIDMRLNLFNNVELDLNTLQAENLSIGHS